MWGIIFYNIVQVNISWSHNKIIFLKKISIPTRHQAGNQYFSSNQVILVEFWKKNQFCDKDVYKSGSFVTIVMKYAEFVTTVVAKFFIFVITWSRNTKIPWLCGHEMLKFCDFVVTKRNSFMIIVVAKCLILEKIYRNNLVQEIIWFWGSSQLVDILTKNKTKKSVCT